FKPHPTGTTKVLHFFVAPIQKVTYIQSLIASASTSGMQEVTQC
ncbi:MAG: hypothetical protein ACI9MS_003745, partial [Glaciecola sp.]